MNKTRAALFCVLALATALIGAQAIRAASTVSWELSSTGLPANGIVRDVAFGNVNTDGKPDLVVAFTGGPGLAVYGRNAGVWSSTSLTIGLPATGSYERLAVGDINADGRLDILASRGGSAGVGVFFGNGIGGWTPITTSIPTTGAYRGVALAPVTTGNWLGLVVAGPGNGGIQVLPDGVVTTTGTYNEVAAAYVTEDGYVDVAATHDSTGVYFWKGAPGGVWTLARSGLPTTLRYRGLALGDVDNDGRAELVAGRAGVPPAGGIFIYDWSDAGNSWSLAANQISTTVIFGRIELRDINNDGWLDVVAAGYPTTGGQGLAAWLSGPFGFTAAASPAVTSTLSSLSLADFDLDGLMDVAAGDSSNGGALAWRGNGVQSTLDAWLELPSPQTKGSPLSVGHGDLNRDGWLDVVLPAADGGLEGWTGNGGNGWTGCSGLRKAVLSGAYGDVLMDVFPQVGQDPTIIAARTDGGGLTFVHGVDCSGGGGAYAITATGSYGGLSAGDVFHNGNLGVVAASSVAKGGLRLWQRTPAGSWLAPTSLAISATIRDTALGDVDHDGILEIATADSGGAGVSIYDYSAAGWGRNIVISSGEYYAIGLGDVNNDGDLDIVAARNGAGKGIDVWTGAGSANTWTYHAGPDALDQRRYYALDLADFNHDGHLDILAARDGDGVMLWAGNGAGVWTPAVTNLPTGGVFYSASFGHIDHDGNLDLLATEADNGVRLWSAADAAPPTITPFRPSLWITNTQNPILTAHVLDAGSGISATSGGYRYSTNAGSTWSGWFPAPISGPNGSTAQQTMTTTAVPFGQDSQDRNVIEFRAADMAGNWGTAQSAIWIDTTPPVPASLFSYEREAGTWSTNRYITVTFGVTDATSGWQDSAVLLDQTPSTLPPAIANTTDIHYTAGPLGDGAWYAHLRGRDGAGNWSTTARHFGPLGVDTTPPTNPTSLYSTNHLIATWSGNGSITMSWSGASDSGSGVRGYSYVWDHSPGTLPDTVTETLATTMDTYKLTGSDHWFHLRTRDNVGNWAATAVHAGPYYIDTTAPTSSASSPGHSSSTSFTVSWSGSDVGSGIASYDIQSRDKSVDGIWTDWKPAQTGASATFTGLGGHIYEFRSRARDHVGNLEAYPSYADSTTDVETIDLFIRTVNGAPGGPPAIEVNQSSQTLNNSVPIFAKKRTFVRCYVQSSTGSYTKVKARLKVYSNDVYQGIVTPINPGAAITLTTNPIRINRDDAFLFDVPAGYVKMGVARFECEINYPIRKYAESNYANNTASVSLGVGALAGVLDVNMVDVRFWAPDGLRQIRNEDRWRLESLLEAAYPIQWVNPTWTYLNPYYDSEPGLSDVLSDLDDNVGDVDEALSVHHYGMLYQPDPARPFAGLGRRPGLVAAGDTGPLNNWMSTDLDGSFGDAIGAHEIGHNLGREHVHCAGNEDEDGNGTIDNNYPYPTSWISPGLDPWNGTTVYGIDGSVSPPRLIPPSWGDLMGYCQPNWPSPYTYLALWNANPASAEQAAAQGPQGPAVDRLAIYGSVVTPTQVVTLSAFYHVTSATDRPGRDTSGAYSIRFFGEDGALLQNYPFSPVWAEYPSMEGGISERVPWISTTRSIAIWRGETALITRTVSAHAPEVTMTWPNGGETLNGATATAAWSASDEDPGDTLTYRLAYSRDGGATWQGISPSLHHPTATLDLSILPGTTQGKFQVTASDGVNTTSDATDGVFTVPGKLPEITHLEPLSGTTYIHGQTVTFQGGAYDVDDNVLRGDRLTWSSSLMGNLGTGELIQRVDLIAGTHTITLTATDSQSNAVSASVVITVEQGDDGYPIYLPLVFRQAVGQ